MSNITEPVTSPCIRTCCLDDDNVCIGCGRTLDEIRDWSEMTETEKHATLRLSTQRRAERQKHFLDAMPR